MQLFYTINSWAGRNEFADAALRLFYVAAVPLLATVLAALLIFLPRHPRTPSRLLVAASTVLAGLLCALAMRAVESFALNLLGTDTLSPRPFVTHYVNLLVVEPNDNSFPSPEVMLAAALVIMIWAAQPSAALALTAVFTLALFAFTRVYCGTNYVADVGAGTALGMALGALSLAICRVPLAVPIWGKRHLVWRLPHQAAFSSVSVLIVAALTLTALSHTPRYEKRMQSLFREQAATAAPVTASTIPGAPVDTRLAGIPPVTQNLHLHATAAGEGEGAPATPYMTRDMPPAGETTLGGYLPEAEKSLYAALLAIRLPHRLVSVDVAQVRTGNSAYRCAAVRFEVRQSGVAERQRVVETAANIVRRAFHVDPQLQNVDIAGVVLNDPEQAQEQRYVFAAGAVPVFTASVARRNLRIVTGPQWVNAPGVDGGSWLRARSRLYINTQVLPPAPRNMMQKPVAPVPTLTPGATPAPNAEQTPVVAPTPMTTRVVPAPTTKDAPRTVAPSASPAPRVAPPVDRLRRVVPARPNINRPRTVAPQNRTRVQPRLTPQPRRTPSDTMSGSATKARPSLRVEPRVGTPLRRLPEQNTPGRAGGNRPGALQPHEQLGSQLVAEPRTQPESGRQQPVTGEQ